jgi:hypothetical protein
MTQRPRARSEKILAEPNICPEYGQENPARAFLLPRVQTHEPDRRGNQYMNKFLPAPVRHP